MNETKNLSEIEEQERKLEQEEIAKLKIKVNLIQNSALSFSVCILNEPKKIEKLIQILSTNFSIKYNKNLTLLTIRHYSEITIKEIINNRTIVLEQKNRTSARFILKEK